MITYFEVEKESRKCVLRSDEKPFLGYEGENNANTLVFTFKDGFIDGLGQLAMKRGEDNGFKELKKLNETYQLPVEADILIAGDIEFQLVITQADGTVYKFQPFVMTVRNDLDADGEMPADLPSWTIMANTKLAEVDEAITNAEKATKNAEDVANNILEAKKNGEFNGKDGKDGKDGINGTAGKDGVSPTFETTQVEGGAKIEITDVKGVHEVFLANGPQGVQGMQGVKGDRGEQGIQGVAGKDGVSPTVSTQQTSTGATITITDKTGTHTATLLNGKDGKDGADGTMSFEELSDEQKASLKGEKGEKGDTGATGLQGEQGPKGETGPQGPQGPTGPAGENGLTPHIGNNGNWWIGDTDLGVSAGGSGGSATLPDRAYFNYHKGEAPVTNTFLSLTNTSLRGIELDSDGNPILKAGKTYKITLSLYGCNIQNKSTNRFVLSKTKSDGTKNNVSFIYPPSAASAGGQGQNLPSSVCIEIPIKDFSLQIWAIHATLADFVTTGCTSLAFDLMVDEII